jgi:proline racemase
VLAEGQIWRNDSIIGTTFHARAIGQASGALLTDVEGTAYRTG